MDKRWLLWGAGAVALLALLGTKGKGGGDVPQLARMLIAETQAARNAQEMAQIVWVALNRARNRGVSPGSVVSPYLKTGIWNNGAKYRRDFESAHNHPNWAKAQAFVRDVLAGKYPQTIGGRTSFVHPKAMAAVPCVNAPNVKEMQERVPYEGNCVPRWATINPVKVGGALFA